LEIYYFKKKNLAITISHTEFNLLRTSEWEVGTLVLLKMLLPFIISLTIKLIK
jgi:hypothetical protein